LVGELCGTGSIKIRLDDARVSPAYFALYFGSDSAQRYLRDAATGTIMPNISPKVLGAMPIQLPERATQQQIVEGWTAIDALERALGAYITGLRRVFESMLSALLTDTR
jgi:restriction endonuclease S subunit